MQGQESQGAAEEEAGDLVRKVPDAFVGAYTVALASNMLVRATEAFNGGDFDSALEEARNALRVAASAVLFRDGYVARTLEASCEYLEKNYKGRFPTAAWKEVEEYPTTRERHIGEGLLEALGLTKDMQYKEKDYARNALHAAEDFVRAAMDVVVGPEGGEEAAGAEAAAGEGEAQEEEEAREEEEEAPEEPGVAG